MSVTLHPGAISFKRPFNKVGECSLTITNNNQHAVAFRVKTTAPKSYCVRPNSGRVEPRQSVDLLVTMMALGEDPPLDVECKDRFLIQSTLITLEKAHLDLRDRIWSVRETDEEEDRIYVQKLRVVYLPALGQNPEEEEEGEDDDDDDEGMEVRVLARVVIDESDDEEEGEESEEEESEEEEGEDDEDEDEGKGEDEDEEDEGEDEDEGDEEGEEDEDEGTEGVVPSVQATAEANSSNASASTSTSLPALSHQSSTETIRTSLLPNVANTETAPASESKSKSKAHEAPEPDEILSLRPVDVLDFRRPPPVFVRRSLHIANKNKQPVAFKVDTIDPKLYYARPNLGRLEPGKCVTVSVVTLSSLNTECKDEILILSTFVTPEIESVALPDLFIRSDSANTSTGNKIFEKKLRVAHLPAEDPPQVGEADFAKWLDSQPAPSNHLPDLPHNLPRLRPPSPLPGFVKNEIISLYPGKYINFRRPLTKPVRCFLTVTNINELPVAFKVKTTAPKIYCAKPNLGRLEQGESVDVMIDLQPFKEEPPLDIKCKDKFLIESTVITPEKENLSLQEIWSSPGTSEEGKIFHQKLHVVYLPKRDQSIEESLGRAFWRVGRWICDTVGITESEQNQAAEAIQAAQAAQNCKEGLFVS